MDIYSNQILNETMDENERTVARNIPSNDVATYTQPAANGQMPNVMMPERLTNEALDLMFDFLNGDAFTQLNRRGNLPRAIISDENNPFVRPAPADSAFNDWLNGLAKNVKKTHVTVAEATMNEVNRFLDTVPAGAHVTKLKYLVETYEQLVENLSMGIKDRLDERRYHEIRTGLSILTNGDAFHEAIREFNNATGFQYAKEFGLKCLTNMSLNLDGVAISMEEMTLDAHEKALHAFDFHVERADEAYNDFKNKLKFEVDARNLADDMTMEQVQAAQAKNEEDIRKVENQINAMDKERADLNNSKQARQAALKDAELTVTQKEGFLQDVHKNLEKAKAEADRYKNAIDAGENVIKAFTAEKQTLENLKANLSKSTAVQILESTDLSKEPKMQRYVTQHKGLALTDDLDADLDAFNVHPSLLREVLYPTMPSDRNNLIDIKSPDLTKNELERNTRYNHAWTTIIKLKDIYNQLQPETHQTTGLFGTSLFKGEAKPVTFEETLKDIMRKHGSDSDCAGIVADLKGKLNLCRQKLQKRVENMEADAEFKNAMLKKVDTVRTQKMNAAQTQIDELQSNIQRTERDQDNNRAMREYALNFYNDGDIKIKSAQKDIDEAKAEVENKKNDIAKADARRAELDTQIAAANQTLKAHEDRTAELQKHVFALTTLEQKARITEASKELATGFFMRVTSMPKLVDNRLNRITARAASYYAARNEGAKENHNDSTEYKAMIDALEKVKNMPSTSLDDANKVADTKELLNNLKAAAEHYMQAKGSRVVFGSKMRFVRLNYARELASWAATVAEASMKEVAPMSAEIENRSQKYRDPNFRQAFQNASGKTMCQLQKAQQQAKQAQNVKQNNVQKKVEGPVNAMA